MTPATARSASRWLTISDDLDLPLEAVTETFAIIGKRGMGKTATGVALAEELIGAGQPVVILDPTGVWWGLRSSADGNHPGLPVVIVGGEHADLPLHETAGALLADVVVEQRVPMVLDLSLLSKSATRRFATDFLERLYHRNREPLHVVLDEADLLCPQRVPAGMERLLGAVNDLARRGRVRGLGVTLISQRPAVINKDVLSQAEVLVALRLTGKLDRDAVNAWVDAHAVAEEGRDLRASLPALPVGTAWVWSPGWLHVLRKVAVRRRHTFDSSATPKPGERVVQPRRFADVDLRRLKERLDALAQPEKSSGKHPAPSGEALALRKRVADLEHALTNALAMQRPVEVSVLTADQVQSLTRAVEHLDAAVKDAAEAAGPIREALARVTEPQPPNPAAVPAPTVEAPPRPRPAAAEPGNGERRLGRAERAILTVLAQHGRLGIVQVALLAGYSANGGGFRNALGALRTAGFITPGADPEPTEQGLAALSEWEPLPSGPALLDWWYRQLGKAERLALAELVQAWPAALSVEQLAERTGYAAGGGGFRNALGRLRSLQLADGRGQMRAADTLGRAKTGR